MAVAFTQPSFEAWWRDEYLPAARKYAELLEAQKPVELLVGDVVGPTLEYLERRIKSGRNPTGHVDAVIQEISFGAATLNRYFFVGLDTPIDARCLRLISRPKKLTVRDLPEIEGLLWETVYNGDKWRAIVNIGNDSFEGEAHKTEHEACQAALDFLNKIWAAKPEGA
ncbi:MAG TPA: hypothetical protein VLA12_20875 [Planctomycetaceae bacterium]|nr:hypothetical protein [Planctomycetaceae bacterium]